MNFQSTVIVVSIINDSLLIQICPRSVTSEISFDNYFNIVDIACLRSWNRIFRSPRSLVAKWHGLSTPVFHVPSRPSTIYIHVYVLLLVECRREGSRYNHSSKMNQQFVSIS